MGRTLQLIQCGPSVVVGLFMLFGTYSISCTDALCSPAKKPFINVIISKERVKVVFAHRDVKHIAVVIACVIEH